MTQRAAVCPWQNYSAEFFIVLYCQQQKFQHEIEALSQNTKVSLLSPIYVLGPVLKNKLLRVGGRLQRSAMPEEAKHPIILAKEQHIFELILKYLSANGTNFVGAERELREALVKLDQDVRKSYLAHMEINWTFNPCSIHAGAQFSAASTNSG